MGGSSSKATVNHLTSIAVDVTNKNIQSCVASAQQSQLLKLRNVKGDIKLSGVNQRQASSINMKCIFTSEMQTKIQNDVAAQISNFVKSSAGDLTSALGGADSVSETNIRNMFKTGIHNETVTKQAVSSIQEQTISIEDVDGSVIIDGIDQSQSSKIVAEAIINSSQYSGVLNQIADKIDAQTSSKSTGIFNSMFEAFGNMFKYIAIIAAIAAAVVALAVGGWLIVKMFSSRGAGSAANVVKTGIK